MTDEAKSMQEIDKAFYNLAIKERDTYATLLTLCEAERDTLRAQRDAAVEALEHFRDCIDEGVEVDMDRIRAALLRAKGGE